MPCSWDKVTFGETGLRVSPIALGSSYGLGDLDVERAYERGLNFFLWGALRRESFGHGVRNLARDHRENMVIAVQTYTRIASVMSLGLDSALRRLRTDYVDLLVLSWWQDVPPRRIIDKALALRDSGKVRHLIVSCHHRPSFVAMMKDPALEAIMIRYNAAHPGAEREVFPHLSDRVPGVLGFTATRWGSLLKPKLMPAGERVPRGSDCYRFVLSNPSVHVSLAGPKNGAELDEAMAALDRGPLDEAEMAWMRRVGLAVRGDGKANQGIQVLDRLVGADKHDRPQA